MAFANEESVMSTIETVVRELWQNLLNHKLPSKFPQITYNDAMTIYGSDKPDTRFGMRVSVTTSSVIVIYQHISRYLRSANG